jgi:DNA polymerase
MVEGMGMNCKSCPLRDQKQVKAVGPRDAKIVLVGEAPGAHEAHQGEPFVGPAGAFLNWGLGQAGLFRRNIYITNTIKCRPPNNKIDSYEGQEAIECCKEQFVKELNRLTNVKVIIALGGTAMKSLGIEGSITKSRGSVYMYNNIPVVPTYHPSYLNRMVYSKEQVSSYLPRYVWISDLMKAKDIAVMR